MSTNHVLRTHHLLLEI